MARLGSLTFSFGPTGTTPGETIKVPSVLLFVGPNESGKSLALTLVKEWYDGSHDKIDNRIYKSGDFEVFDKGKILEFLKPLLTPSGLDERDEFFLWSGTAQGSIGTGPRADLSSFSDPDSFDSKSWRSGHLSRLRIAPTLESMISIMNESDARPLGPDSVYANIYQLLLSDRDRLNRVNQLVKYASGFYLAVQVQESGKFQFQLNPNEPPAEIPGMILSRELKEYYQRGLKPATFGDGLRTFMGLVLSIFPFEHKLVVIDEPELHLHPPLTRRLAQELVIDIQRRNGQLLIATHSPDFVAGCIATTNDITMVRLTHSKFSARSTARIIRKSQLEPFVTDRVVRNTDALSGIFHETTVVVEGVLDKIAYSEFNRCLEMEGRGREIRDPHFVSAGSCAQVLNVANVLLQTGTPTAAVLDFDVLFSDSIQWNESILNQIEVPSSDQNDLMNLIDEVKRLLHVKVSGLEKKEAKATVKQNGLNLLDGSARSDGETLLHLLAKSGVFIVADGEVESLVANSLGFSRLNLSKDRVVIEIGMKKLANNEYAIPENLSDPLGSIWSLLSGIGAWAKSRVD